LAGSGVRIVSPRAGELEVHGVSAVRIGELAAQEGIVLHELSPQKASLEQAFMALTGESVEYRAGSLTATAAATLEKAA
jgi:ABC-2 type transport system ATP-binding protein